MKKLMYVFCAAVMALTLNSCKSSVRCDVTTTVTQSSLRGGMEELAASDMAAGLYLDKIAQAQKGQKSLNFVILRDQTSNSDAISGAKSGANDAHHALVDKPFEIKTLNPEYILFGGEEYITTTISVKECADTTGVRYFGIRVMVDPNLIDQTGTLISEKFYSITVK